MNTITRNIIPTVTQLVPLDQRRAFLTRVIAPATKTWLQRKLAALHDWIAPTGYEDDKGFHYGTPPKQ